MIIDCKKNEIFNLNQEDKYTLLLTKTKYCFVCVLLFKVILCKVDDFSALTAIKFINENIEKCTMMHRTTTRNGIDCCRNETLLICLAATIFDWMGLNCYICQIVACNKLY